MSLSLIAAVAENGVIGHQGDLPWHLQSDLRRFRTLTLGHTVVAGRKTHEAIVRRLGTPLPGRRTIVLTRDTAYAAAGCQLVHSWEEAVCLAVTEEVFVIGGAEVYALALSAVDRLYLTRVHAAVPGDAYFPNIRPRDWTVVRQVPQLQDATHDFACTFEDLVRIETAAPRR